MTFLNRRDYVTKVFKILFLITLLLISISIVMGEDPNIILNQGLELQFSEIHQLNVVLGEPVTMYQELTVKNPTNKTINSVIVLNNYPEEIPSVYLDEMTSISISSGGDTLLAQPVVPISLASYSSKNYILEYKFVPVQKEINCTEYTIKDLLPKDATILPSSLPPETIVKKKCDVRIHHEGKIHYYNVEITLDELKDEDIKSIYYVEENQYLTLNKGVISLTK